MILFITLAMLSCIPASAQHRSAKSPNQICIERGHIILDSIPIACKSDTTYVDELFKTFQVITPRIEYHAYCKRCGELIVWKDQPKKYLIWESENIPYPKSDTTIIINNDTLKKYKHYNNDN